MTMADLW